MDNIDVRLHKCVYLDALQVNRVHDRALKKLDGREMTFEQTLQLQVGWFSVHSRAYAFRLDSGSESCCVQCVVGSNSEESVRKIKVFVLEG